MTLFSVAGLLAMTVEAVKLSSHDEDPVLSARLKPLNCWDLNDAKYALKKAHPQAGDFFDFMNEYEQKKMLSEGGVDSVAMALPALGAALRGEDPVKGAILAMHHYNSGNCHPW